MALRADVAAVRAAPRLQAVDVTNVRRELLDLADSWRSVLGHDPTNARPIVTALLIGRVTMTPTTERKVWELRGKGTLSGLFTREICRKVVRPHRDSVRCAQAQRKGSDIGIRDQLESRLGGIIEPPDAAGLGPRLSWILSR